MGTIRAARRRTTEHPPGAVPNSAFDVDAVSVVSIEDDDVGVFTQPVHDDVCIACAFCEDVCERTDCAKCQSKSVEPICAPCGVLTGSNRSYSMCQIRRHNHMGSAWLVAGDTVYDATPYINSHPGGAECILRKAGGAQDCTRDLEFHSARGKQLFKKFVIGKVRPCPGCSVFKADKTEKLKWFLW
jgi:NAD-dependent dihydropyrimidine dehydrogenase PreA subunit